MEVHKGIANKLIDAVAHTTPSSSSLKQKSIMLQKIVVPFSIMENNDEAEWLARRREFSKASVSVSFAVNSNERRCSLRLSAMGNIPSAQMEASVSQCIKLGTENKIDPKNAFSMEMIDFMTYMIRKQDANMSNLQVASVSLNISTKIYGSCVDYVHMDILKLIGGLENQEKNNENVRDDAKPMDIEEGNENNPVQTRKKTWKRMKQQIPVTVENRRTNVEIKKPTLTSMESDLQSMDMLFQATLLNHTESRFYFHPYNDILMDTVKCKRIQDNDINYCILIIKYIS